jgi:protein SCO1/2
VKSRYLVTWALLLLTFFAACNRTHRYPMQGEVVATNEAAGEITVNHGDIPGFMEAMAMPYRVKDRASIQQIRPGDKIAAEVVVGSDRSDYWLENVRITDESGRGQIKLPPGSKMLMPGMTAPDATLINQDGQKIRLADFAGKATLVTFIYTRCPMPDFISFDPKYDTPAVLRRYGLGYLDGDASGFSHWDFASAKADDMRRLADAFGLEYGGDENQITHSMVIVLIAPDGTVANYWGTNWTRTELMESMRAAIKQK